MKILVFGETGQLAQALANSATEHDLAFLGRRAADLRDPAQCARLILEDDAELVINAAAYTAVDRAEAEEDLARVINADAPAAMARAAASRGVPFVHVSTDYVFSGSGKAPYRPEDPAEPINAYGRSKREGEIGVVEAGGQYAIIRTSWVFSSHGRNFVKTMLKLGAERDSLSVVADQIGGPTSADDLARVVLSVGGDLAGGAPSGIHHFSGAPDVSWAMFAREIFKLTGLAAKVTDQASSDYPTPARRPENSRLDCSSLLDVYGIERPDWRLSLRRVLAQLQEQRHVGS